MNDEILKILREGHIRSENFGRREELLKIRLWLLNRNSISDSVEDYIDNRLEELSK